MDGERAVRLQGSKAHPLTAGFLCARTIRYLDRVYSPDRITRPLLRRNGALVPVSWDEALGRAAAELLQARREHGPHAVMHYRSAGSMSLTKKLSDRFWNLFGGVTELVGDFCLGAGKEALQRHFGACRPHAWSDLLHSRTIVLWGSDPFTSGPHLLPFLRRAGAAGARVIAINPTHLGHPSIVHEHLRVRPGGDLALALGVAKILVDEGQHDAGWIRKYADGFEPFRRELDRLDLGTLCSDCGLDEETVNGLARRLSEGAPTAILLGTGVIRHGVGLEAAEAVAMLPALLGTVGREGRGISFSASTTRGMDLSWLAPRLEVRNREVICSRFPERLAALDPPVQVAWIECANPANAFADAPGAAAALASVPFKVALDFHRTSTTDLADLVLPITSFLEEDGLVPSWGHFYVGVQRAALAPVGESRPDLRIYQELARQLGFGAEMEGDAMDWCRRLTAPLDLDLDDDADHALNLEHEEVPWADGRFETASGRFEFLRSLPTVVRPAGPDPDYPVQLLTPKSAEHHLSQVLPPQRRRRYDIRLSPVHLERLGIRDGEAVRLRSRTGTIEALARADGRLAEDVAVLPQSGWGADGNDVNQLMGPEVAADGVTFAYYDCFVRVEALH